MLRVDEEGCLVPGCHLVSTEEEAAAPALSLHLYPNPAQEYLYVLLRDAGIAHRRGAALQLLDLQGRILQSHPADRIDEVTSILPVPTCCAMWRTGRFWRRSGWWCGEAWCFLCALPELFKALLVQSLSLDLYQALCPSFTLENLPESGNLPRQGPLPGALPQLHPG